MSDNIQTDQHIENYDDYMSYGQDHTKKKIDQVDGTALLFNKRPNTLSKKKKLAYKAMVNGSDKTTHNSRKNTLTGNGANQYQRKFAKVFHCYLFRSRLF